MMAGATFTSWSTRGTYFPADLSLIHIYNAIRAEFGGTITAICANPGDTVSEDDVLMKIG